MYFLLLPFFPVNKVRFIALLPLAGKQKTTRRSAFSSGNDCVYLHMVRGKRDPIASGHWRRMLRRTLMQGGKRNALRAVYLWLVHSGRILKPGGKRAIHTVHTFTHLRRNLPSDSSYHLSLWMICGCYKCSNRRWPLKSHTHFTLALLLSNTSTIEKRSWADLRFSFAASQLILYSDLCPSRSTCTSLCCKVTSFLCLEFLTSLHDISFITSAIFFWDFAYLPETAG